MSTCNSTQDAAIAPLQESQAEARRTRHSGRSRKGCLTCREKHLKCDEAKPFCFKCIEKGRTCKGYNRGFRFSSRHELKAIHRKEPAGSGMQEDAHQSEGVSPLSGSFLASNNVWLPNTSLTGENHNEAMLGPDSFYRPRSPNHVGLSDDSQIFEEHIVDLGLRWPDPSADAILPPPASAAAENAIDEQTGYSTTEGSIDAHVDEMTSFANQNPLSFTEFDETNFLIQSYAPQAGASFRTSQFPLDSDIISWPFSTSISRDHLQNAQVPRSVTHLPSVLVTHWFERVCLIWSGYDSHLNLNRNIAAQLWQDSEPVYNCLQSMSAASLSANIPHMRKTATAHLGCAVRDISALKGKILETGQQKRLSAALIFSLLCLGTSSSWIEASHLGTPFFKEARGLLNNISRNSLAANTEDEHLTRYFEESLSYCEMLLAAVGCGYERQLPRGQNEETSQAATSPHPWTGIFSDMPKLFTKVLNICWEFRKDCTKPGTTISELQYTLRLIEEAKSIHEQLKSLSLPAEATHLAVSGTADERTPLDHFVAIAEAYRLASILHLCQTFADVVSMRMPGGDHPPMDRQAQWTECITPLSLRLVEVLQTIPSESGTKIMQILLCISASTGLRFHSSPGSTGALLGEKIENISNQENMSITEYADMFNVPRLNAIETTSCLDQPVLDIGEARGFLLKRMNDLENNLPPRPIVVAKKLIRSIWERYDAEAPGKYEIHWIDIMDATGLRSFFG